MLVRYLQDLIGSDRDIATEKLNSRRLLLARDGQSYSFHDTLIKADSELHIWYRHHTESVYCVGGEGELEDVRTGAVHPVYDGMFYCLDDHEPHILRARTDLRLICVFTPALAGPEIHDPDGAFPLLTDEIEVTTLAGEPLGMAATNDAVVATPGAVVRPRRARPRKKARSASRATNGSASAEGAAMVTDQPRAARAQAVQETRRPPKAP